MEPFSFSAFVPPARALPGCSGEPLDPAAHVLRSGAKMEDDAEGVLLRIAVALLAIEDDDLASSSVDHQRDVPDLVERWEPRIPLYEVKERHEGLEAESSGENFFGQSQRQQVPGAELAKGALPLCSLVARP
ncbi:hypothetical protein [Polyangium fumosum]|uniref:hypothetical protein n=1 Tax=Polyangium fumosum TaxID=889272 RepID=UPI00147909C6|nr:hypothetical protein [Polyangium fumosum]